MLKAVIVWQMTPVSVIEWSWLAAWFPGCLFRGLHTVFRKLWGYSTPLGIETFWSGVGLEWRAWSLHTLGADGEHHVPSEALGIWLHAAFLNCIKLNANGNDICLPKQCFAATFHAHTHTHTMGRGLGTKSQKTHHKIQYYAVH